MATISVCHILRDLVSDFFAHYIMLKSKRDLLTMTTRSSSALPHGHVFKANSVIVNVTKISVGPL